MSGFLFCTFWTMLVYNPEHTRSLREYSRCTIDGPDYRQNQDSMTKRYVGSLLIGVLIGLLGGMFLGWEQFPVEYKNSSLSALAPHYQDEYTLMVAEGYQHDQDVNAALARLRPLNKANIPAYVRDLTERYISQSNVPAIPAGYLLDQMIQVMVALSEAFGWRTPVMEIYRSTPVPAATQVQ